MAAWIDQPTMDRLRDQLLHHEGIRLDAYRDTVGVWTIGAGHTGPAAFEGARISLREANGLLVQDMQTAIRDARRFAQRIDHHLTFTRRAVLINMAFNLGLPRLKQFIALERAIWREDWRGAAAEMIDSLWAEQVKWRALDLAGQMLLDRFRTTHFR